MFYIENIFSLWLFACVNNGEIDDSKSDPNILAKYSWSYFVTVKQHGQTNSPYNLVVYASIIICPLKYSKYKNNNLHFSLCSGTTCVPKTIFKMFTVDYLCFIAGSELSTAPAEDRTQVLQIISSVLYRLSQRRSPTEWAIVTLILTLVALNNYKYTCPLNWLVGTCK